MNKTRIKIILGLVYFLVNLPIGLFLMYSILKAGNYDRLVWFLWIANIPIMILSSMLTELIKYDE